MTDKSLSALYRRLTARPASLALDAETLASAAEGTLAGDEVAAVLSRSPREAALVRMLGALNAESETLAAGVAHTTRETTHRRPARTEHRVAAGRRHAGVTRWATALAACLVAVVGMFSLRHSAAPTTEPQTHAHAIAKADRISHFGMEQDAAGGKPDELFHSDFSGGG
jgi:hypothetical protein